LSESFQQQEAQLATGRYFTQTDFRQFNLNFAWGERTSVALQTTGLILLNSVEYDALYQVNYDLPGAATGSLGLYGTNFTKNASNHLTGGLVQALVADFVNGTSSVRQSRVEGVSVSAVTLHAAMRTADMDDDQLVLRSMFRGDDTITFSPLADYAYGFGGDDTLYGEGGNDTVFGQSGDDAVLGSSGNDFLSGGFGSDRLFGGYDADILRGNNGRDALSGGGGADRFDFNPGDDSDTISDWADGVDTIRIYGTESVDIVAIAGGDVRIFGTNLIIEVANADVADFQVVTGSGFISLI
jgi:Ca2+-binding RTX toxin-like protein